MKKESSFKMKGFSGFKSSPLEFKLNNKIDMSLNDNLNKVVRDRYYKPKLNAKQRQKLASKAKMLKNFAKQESAKDFLRKNTIKPKKLKKLWRPLGPGTRPFAKNVTKVLKPLTKRIPYIGAAITAYPYVKKAMKEVIPGLKKRAKRELKGGSMYISPKI